MPLAFLKTGTGESPDEARRRVLRSGSDRYQPHHEPGQPFSPSLQKGISRGKVALVAFAAFIFLPIFVYLPWINFLLSPPKSLPNFWARASVHIPDSSIAPSILTLPSPVCQIVKASAADPYKRTPPLDKLDKQVQELANCEDVEMNHEKGFALFSCDNGRPQWNTCMSEEFFYLTTRFLSLTITFFDSPDPRGALWIYDYHKVARGGTAAPVIVKLVGFPSHFDFHPLGTAMYDSPNTKHSSTTRLFVVNHRRTRSTIEVFDLESKGQGWSATYVRSISHPASTHTPNSIHALSPSSLLVTNDHLFARRPSPRRQLTSTLRLALPLPTILSHLLAPRVASVLQSRNVSGYLAQAETLLGLPLGWVSYVSFDESQGRSANLDPAITRPSESKQEAEDTRLAQQGILTSKIVASGIPFANGLALSPSSKTMVVASTMYPGVYIYDIKKDQRTSRVNWSAPKSSVRLKDKVYLPMSPDNLSFSPVKGSHLANLTERIPEPEADSHEGAKEDLFERASLIVGGHPAGLKLIAMAKDPKLVSNWSPSWVVKVEPSPTFLKGHKTISAHALGDKLVQDRGAPLSATTRVLGQRMEWRIQTLFQSNGNGESGPSADQVWRGDGELRFFPSSTGGAWDPTVQGRGTLLVGGLYADGLLACTEVGRELSDEGSKTI
ncbi:hypothetical protein IE53DRAFT_359427 [Violaceomyces palustris]|uniref:Uncharacterized protein n=1 Tax=Violaceomyces palustris TaxID=1673888 RepID=A0ACD0P7Z2_9BASI|nr:hypothetical protein IE53DRAFT_359427 [Violaceomyces palustris]